MLRKNKDNQVITKKDLRQELGSFIEEVLLPGMREVFVTKKDLEKTIDKALESQSKSILEAVDFGFRKNNEKFEGIDKKFEGIDKKFEGIDKKFEGIDKQFVVVAERFDKIDQKFEKVDEQIKEKFDKVLDGQDKICKQLTNLQTESKSGTKIYNRNKKKIEDHEERISVLELKPSSL